MLDQFRESNAFLSELSPAEAATLRSHLVPCELRVGDRLHFQGGHVDDVIFPHSGVVAMTMPAGGETGAAVVLIGRDGIVGGFAAAAAAPASCDAIVCIGGQASRMSATAYRSMLDQEFPIRRWAARFDSAMTAQAQQTALCHAAHPVEARICRWLLEIQDRSGSSAVTLTQNTLAQMLGVRRTTVTLVAGHLEAAGVVKCHRGYVEIINQAELERRGCECYSHVRNYLDRLFAGRTQAAPAELERERAGAAPKRSSA
jgi:CRP-like cAMP-binding protein